MKDNKPIFKTLNFKKLNDENTTKIKIKLFKANNNNNNNNNNSFVESEGSQLNFSLSKEKKITILDLCADEKAKIGMLLKKLAEEQEINEKYKKYIKVEEEQQQQKEEEELKSFNKTNNNTLLNDK